MECNASLKRFWQVGNGALKTNIDTTHCRQFPKSAEETRVKEAQAGMGGEGLVLKSP